MFKLMMISMVVVLIFFQNSFAQEKAQGSCMELFLRNSTAITVRETVIQEHNENSRAQGQEYLQYVDGQIKSFFATADRANQKIIDDGGFTPKTLLDITQGAEIIFKDGQSFIVDKTSRLINGFITMDILPNLEMNLSLPVAHRFELVVAGYSGENPISRLLDLPTQIPSETLRFIAHNYEKLSELVPLRHFYKFSADGMYAVVEKIPPFKNDLMTLENFVKQGDLSLQDKQLLAQSLLAFANKYRKISFFDLDHSRALVFDPRDQSWKFLMLSRAMRRFTTDNFCGRLIQEIYASMSETSDIVFLERLIGEFNNLSDSIDFQSL